MIEEWKSLDGYEKQYEISNLGNIFSLEREVLMFGKIPRTLESQKIKTRPQYKGYLRFCVWKNNKKETIYVHRAVAIAFIPNPKNLEIVNHKDLNKENNNVFNLEWVNYKENSNHYYENNKNDDF